MKNNPINREKNVISAVVVSVIIIALFMGNWLQASRVMRARSIQRVEEGVDTVVDEVVRKLDRDSQVLNAAAAILATIDLNDSREVVRAMESIEPLLETMDICLLLPDDRVIQPEGSVLDGAGSLDFSIEAARGEHVSDRVISIGNDGRYLLRHFVPIVQNGVTTALVYGRTWLDDLPEVMNIDNIYNASADVYIIDADTAEFIMDTRHDTLGVLYDYSGRKVRGGDNTWDGVIQDIIDQKSGYTIYQSQDGDREWNYFYYRPVGINQWSIAVSVPENEALKSLYALQRVYYLSGGMILLAIVAYYFWTRRNAIKAVNEAVERAVLEEKLHKAQAAEKAKTTFLSNMSHDIRTPMNAIIGFATLAKNNVDDPARTEDYMEKILSSGNYLLSLINDVLDMSRIESGKLNIEEMPCSISEVFADIGNIVQAQMEAKQLSFTMEATDVADEAIYCDKLHLNQVLLNLLSNAMKFTPAGGSVNLSVCQQPLAPEGCGAYQIRVKDTGIGMSEDFIQHIFEPFERERNSTVSGIQGTGLGMAISKSIVDAMGGTISVQSQEGKGTEFIIDFVFRLQPESEKAKASAPAADVPLIEADLRGKRLLVVEDNELNREIATELLSESGFLVETAEDGSVALEMVKAADAGYYDLILMDVQMPLMNGYDAACAIRALEGEKSTVPIVAMTANAFEEDRQHAMECGMNDHVAKPIDVQVLSGVISRILSQE